MRKKKRSIVTSILGLLFLVIMASPVQAVTYPGITEYKYADSLKEGNRIAWEISNYKNYNIGVNVENGSTITLRVIKDASSINLAETSLKEYQVFNTLFEVKIDGKKVTAENDLSFYPVLIQPTIMVFENGTTINALQHIYEQKARTTSSYLLTQVNVNATHVSIMEVYLTLNNATLFMVYEKDTGILEKYVFMNQDTDTSIEINRSSNANAVLGMDPSIFASLTGILVLTIVFGSAFYALQLKKKNMQKAIQE